MLHQTSTANTQVGNGRAARSHAAPASLTLGALSALTMPVAIVGTRYSDSYELLHAGVAIPLGLALGVCGLAAASRAQHASAITLGRSGGERQARAGRVLGTVGICLALTALISLAVFGVLTYIGEHE